LIKLYGIPNSSHINKRQISPLLDTAINDQVMGRKTINFDLSITH